MTIQDVILAQREERNNLLSRTYKLRHTRHDVDTLLAAHEIKLITGPRRAGKSTMALLMLRGKDFAYLNFDDANLLSLWDEQAVMSSLNNAYPGYEYMLLDEVQNLDNWDLWVSKLFRNGKNVIVTGSNARMLSSEMATVLTGRYLPVEIYPLSLSEAFGWHNMDPSTVSAEAVESLAADYLALGGYPETMYSRGITTTYLSALFEAMVLKDVVTRHNVRNTAQIHNLSTFLLSNICVPFTYQSVTQAVGLGSVNTTRKFMSYLSEPYLFFFLPRYNNKLKLMNKAPKKAYVVDNGFVTAKAFGVSPNTGRLLENMVFIELLRRGYEVGRDLFYYRSRNDKETDFVLRNGHSVERLINVCYDITMPKTRKRELDSITECADELRCDNLTIITHSMGCVLTHANYTVNVLPFTVF